MSDSVYSFREAPSYRGSRPDETFRSALEMPMSRTSTFFDQAKGGALESFGLGTAIRDFTIPEGRPEEDNGFGISDALEIVNPLQRVYPMARDLAQSFINDRDAPSMSEDAYKASAYYRDDVPWDSAMTEDRAAALAESYDARKVREFYASKRPITAFLGNLAGQATDPINYVPIAGPAVRAAATARLGRVAGMAATSAIDAAANTAVFGIATAKQRARYGDDTSWQTTVSQIATAALIGSAFGALGGALEGRRAASSRSVIEERLATLKTTQEARIALNEGIDALARGEEVRLSPNTTEPIARIAAEVEGLSRAYDSVLAEPTGPLNDPLVRIAPEEIDALIVARGAFKGTNQVEFSKGGHGLVKVIWGHGEKSREPAEFQVNKADVVALPEIVRDFDPIPESRPNADSPMRTWRVERDGRVVVYGDKGFDGEQRLVTVHVQKPDAPGADKPLSEKRKPAATGSPDEPLKPVGDTASRSLLSSERGQSLPATENIARKAGVDNSTAMPDPEPVGVKAAEASVGRPDSYREMADQYRVDPESGSFGEEAEVAQLRAEGRLTDEDAAMLDDAQETYDNGAAYGEALKSLVGCLI